MPADHNVFQGRHAGKHLDVLKGPGYPQAGNLIRPQTIEGMSFECDLTGRCRQNPRNQVKQGSFACSVWPDDRLDRALPESERDITDSL